MAHALARRRTPGPVHVASWYLATYRRLWKTNLLSSFVQPMLYMLGLGVGVGTLVDSNSGSTEILGGMSYVAYVAPGLLVTTAMTLGAAESMWPIMGNLKWQRGFHGIAATPLDARDITLGHALWIAARCGIAGGAVAAALALFPQTRSWGLVPAVVMAVLVGVSFAMPVTAFSIDTTTDGSFAGIQRFVIIPLFLFGGAFYPLTQLPTVVQWFAKAAPLWHGVVVARAFTSGTVEWPAVLGHTAYICTWIVAGTVVATRRLHRKLYP